MFGGVLGNKQIRKKLGRDIFIYPFDEANLKGSSYNLTASKLAYLTSNKKIAVNGAGVIIVPPGETVLIQTREAIYIRKNICGTYHSKVSLVSEGFTHIGTTLDPGYMGPSLISLTNTTQGNLKIKYEDSIVTIMFYKVKGCNKEEKDNAPGRDDLIPKEFNGFNQQVNKNKQIEITNEIDDMRKTNWRRDYQALIDIVRKRYDIKPFGLYDCVFIIVCFAMIAAIIILSSRNKIGVELVVTSLVSIVIFIISWIKELIGKNRR